MLLFQRASKPAGNKEVITGFSAPARYRPVAFNKADYANGNGNRPRCVARFAANNANLEAMRGPPQPSIQRSDPCDLRFLRNDKRDQRELRHG